MHLLLTLLLLLSATPAHAPAPPALAVVFVTVEGAASWTPASQAAVIADAAAALAWLHARGLAAPQGVEVLPALALSPADVGTWEWLRDSPHRLTLHAVANGGLDALRLGPNGLDGVFIPPDRVVVLAASPVISRSAAIAHELVHALTGLPDWPACEQVDILCSPGPAYEAGTLGCTTLAALNRPCERTYLAEVSQ